MGRAKIRIIDITSGNADESSERHILVVVDGVFLCHVLELFQVRIQADILRLNLSDGCQKSEDKKTFFHDENLSRTVVMHAIYEHWATSTRAELR